MATSEGGGGAGRACPAGTATPRSPRWSRSARRRRREGRQPGGVPEAFVPGYPDWVWRTRPWDAVASTLYARLLDQALVASAPPPRTCWPGRPGGWESGCRSGPASATRAGATLYNTLLHFGPDGSLAARPSQARAHRRRAAGLGNRRRIGPDRHRHRVGLLGGLICWEKRHAAGPRGSVRPRCRHLPGFHLGQLRRGGADPAPHRQGRPHLRHRRHRLHPGRRPSPGTLPGRADLYGPRRPDDWLSRGKAPPSSAPTAGRSPDR